MHPDTKIDIFFRDNESPTNLVDLYKGDTCYLIGRGLSLKLLLENEELRALFSDNKLTKYCINDSIELFDFHCNIWSAADRPSKFDKRIFKNQNVMKIIPSHRFFKSCEKKDIRKIIAYNENKKDVYSADCSNTIGAKINYINKEAEFIKEFMDNPLVSYGIHGGSKSTLLFAIKVALLLGFSKIILIGVDLSMNIDTPYYGKSKEDYKIPSLKTHVNHNNRLYGFLRKTLNEINSTLSSKSSKYKCELYTMKRINGVTIPEIDIKEEIIKELEKKS